MRAYKLNKILIIYLALFLFLFFMASDIRTEGKKASALIPLLPEIDSWTFSESPQGYFPETLFEYINGAAEIYLSYDFEELIVGQYEKKGSEASLSIEIYNMGNQVNSFGIYSAERFPDSKFVYLGSQGYVEEGNLNFIIGKYYIKLFCFDCNKESENLLMLFSQEIEKKVKDKGNLPPLLKLFPKEGLIQNSEKFILHNFMGYSFFNNGYLANYKVDQLEFDCFLIQGENAEDAKNMLTQYLKTKDNQSIHEISMGYRLQDSYYHNIYMTRVDSCLCGVTKIKEGFEEIGEKYLGALAQSLENKN